jgi:hypothetical protein
MAGASTCAPPPVPGSPAELETATGDCSLSLIDMVNAVLPKAEFFWMKRGWRKGHKCPGILEAAGVAGHEANVSRGMDEEGVASHLTSQPAMFSQESMGAPLLRQPCQWRGKDLTTYELPMMHALDLSSVEA